MIDIQEFDRNNPQIQESYIRDPQDDPVVCIEIVESKLKSRITKLQWEKLFIEYAEKDNECRQLYAELIELREEAKRE